MSIINTPEIPPAFGIGNWVRMARKLIEKPCGTGYRTSHWVVTYENAVGGTVSYRFKTRSAASSFYYNVYNVAKRDGREIALC